MNTNMILLTDIWQYKYKYEYIPHKTNYMLMNINAIKSIKINRHMCHNIWFIVLDKKFKLKLQYLMILFHIYSTK